MLTMVLYKYVSMQNLLLLGIRKMKGTILGKMEKWKSDRTMVTKSLKMIEKNGNMLEEMIEA